MVSEKNILLIFFFHYKSTGANDIQGMANLDRRGVVVVGRIYVGDRQTLLHTKSVSSWPHGFREDF